jgi:hypothetical protein
VFAVPPTTIVIVSVEKQLGFVVLVTVIVKLYVPWFKVVVCVCRVFGDNTKLAGVH